MLSKLKKYKYPFYIVCIGIIYLIICLKFNIGVPCLFNKVTGLYCPGCGITRAVLSMIKLDFYQAVRYNLLIMVLIPFFPIYYILKNICKKNKGIVNIYVYSFLIVIIMYGVLRNLEMFNFLAPTIIK